MSLTQYLESQEDQNMTKLLNFIRTQKGGKEGFFVFFFLSFKMNERRSTYSSSGGNMNERSFNEG